MASSIIDLFDDFCGMVCVFYGFEDPYIASYIELNGGCVVDSMKHPDATHLVVNDWEDHPEDFEEAEKLGLTIVHVGMLIPDDTDDDLY